jgi:hypothetical protein
MTSDLFGKKPKQRRPAYEASLERRDRTTLVERAERVRWIRRKLPKVGMGLPSDSSFVFTEARSTFVDGYFIATLVLAAAFAEHWMTGILSRRGYGGECRRGLRACISCARKYDVWPELVLGRLAHLQTIRNPFIHLKDFDHSHTLTQRSWMRGHSPAEVLEHDAKDALEAIFTLVQLTPVPVFFSPRRDE